MSRRRRVKFYKKECEGDCFKKGKKKCRFRFAPCQQNKTRECTRRCKLFFDTTEDATWEDWKRLEKSRKKEAKSEKELKKAEKRTEKAKRKSSKAQQKAVRRYRKEKKKRMKLLRRTRQRKKLEDKKRQKNGESISGNEVVVVDLPSKTLDNLPLNVIIDILEFI